VLLKRHGRSSKYDPVVEEVGLVHQRQIMLLFDFLQEKSRLFHWKKLLLQVPRVIIFRARSNPRYKCRKMSSFRRRLLRIDLIAVMSPQGRILVTRSRQMRMGKRNLLRRTLNTTCRCADRHAFGNQSRDTAQFRIRSCALLVCFVTLYPGSFLGGRVMKSVRLIGFLHSRFIGWLLEIPRLVPDLPCSSCITRVWPWRRADVLTLFRSAFQSV